MKKFSAAILGSALLSVVLPAAINLAQQQAQNLRRPPLEHRFHVDADRSTERIRETVLPGLSQRNVKSGNMTLTAIDLAHVDQNPELAEKIIKKLRTGLMPPANARKPELETAKAFYTTFIAEIDKAAALKPNPGYRPFQRLTRDEYARSIKDLLGINVDVEKYLPPDMLSEGLDNIADNQQFSATLMEGYIRASSQIVRDALGDPRGSDFVGLQTTANRWTASTRGRRAIRYARRNLAGL
jgi:hypothetical protein